MKKDIPVFDGHNDTLLHLQDGVTSFYESLKDTHIDYYRAKEAGFAGGFFAAYTPSREQEEDRYNYMNENGYKFPLPDRITKEEALGFTHKLAAQLFRIETENPDKFRVVRNVKELKDSIDQGTMAGIFHIEGAECIDLSFDSLYVLYEAGLRSIGPVWSRSNDFGEGVPFCYPSTPDTGGGLTDKGIELIQHCNHLGIMIDTTHLNEKGFWDVAHATTAPIVATHSNVHAICPISRNLTDEQIQEIADSGGVIGINFAVNMLRADGKMETDVSMDEIIAHFRYIADFVGVDHVAFGSDFDGTSIPDILQDVSGTRKVMQALSEDGFTEEELEKIAYKNWVRVLENTWKD
ncbi:dipeptidase [Salimicrobium halophilum]|uniref:Membrane dipeptidase n=1 Tax=Salimicrobium halophilum TaxID=86666 RepID=A0A1G8UQR9_9BACI|nr:dipeptidase [Salimicrobium halophilum]SDJ56089.1 membrane dipeptidase [Salimicrobium halophilum]